MSSGVEIVAEAGRLRELSEGWRELAVERGNAFLTPEWYLAWLEVYGADAAPALAVRHGPGGALAGILPLAASGRRPLRRLGFAGSRLGDLFSPLDRDSDRELATAALARLRDRGERGALVLERVEAGAEWIDGLAAAGEAVTELRHLRGVLPEVELGGATWDEYLAGRSRNLRSQLGRRQRKLEREHRVAFRQTDGARLAADMDAFFALHRGRWEARGGSGAIDDRSAAFHRKFSRAALERGWLRLWVLEVDERPAAVWYGWHVGDRYSYYLAGFDEAYARYSIGMLLLAHTIRHAIEEGAAVYELLLGTEEFKLRFATGERQVRTVIVSAPRHPLRWAALAEDRLRGTLDRFEPETRERLKRPLKVLARRIPGAGR